MAIRFTCMACKTPLKIADRISELRKVRCTGCAVVIVLTPDEDAPDGLIATIPNQAPKTKSEPKLSANQWLIFVGAGAILLVVVIGIWWQFSGPSDRGAIEGDVSLDELPMDGGEIAFEAMEGPKPVYVYTPITRGRYVIRASQGPALGKNKVIIRGGESLRVAPKYNVESKMTIDIKLGSNNADFKVSSR